MFTCFFKLLVSYLETQIRSSEWNQNMQSVWDRPYLRRENASGFHKRWGICWPTERLLASQEGLRGVSCVCVPCSTLRPRGTPWAACYIYHAYLFIRVRIIMDYPMDGVLPQGKRGRDMKLTTHFTEVKNVWGYTCTPHTSSWRDV
jgi:hypothetical protein